MVGRKRISAQIVNANNANKVEPLAIRDMKVTTKTNKSFYFVRLQCRGVPLLSEINNNNCLNAGRDDLIRDLYRLSVKESNGITDETTLSNLRGGIVNYFRYLDKYASDAEPFSLQSMNECITYYNKQSLNGGQASLPGAVRCALAYYLKLMGRVSDARNLQAARLNNPKNEHSALDIDNEFKPIAKVLIRGHAVFTNHLKNNTIPDVHPFYDEELVREMATRGDATGFKFGASKAAFKLALLPSIYHRKNTHIDIDSLKRISVFNQASRCALFLFFLMTGMNATVLYKLKRSDVAFKSIGNGKFVLSGVKGRADFKEIDNALGFTKNAKELMQDWLSASKAIYEYLNINEFDDLPLLPYIDSELNVLDFSYPKSTPGCVNNLIGKILPFKVNATRFRKTKSDILMRATEDVYIVSQGLNNSINVVIKKYTSGIDNTHNRNLSAGMDAQAAIGKGASVEDAVSNAKILHSDILTEYDYKERLKRNEIPLATITPSGVYCRGDESLVNKIMRKNKNLAIDLPEQERKCTSFLSCFDCDSHLLIATESDIWMMLSFFEQVIEMKSIPAKNSIPKSTLHEIEIILERTLKRFKDRAPHEYERAMEKLENFGAHPLFASLHGLSDHLELFNV